MQILGILYRPQSSITIFLIKIDFIDQFLSTFQYKLDYYIHSNRNII